MRSRVRWGCFLAGLLAIRLSAAAAWEARPIAEKAVMFGGRPGTLVVGLRNTTTEAGTIRLGFRWVQRASAISAPVGRTHVVGAFTAAAGQTVLGEAASTPPEVRVPTDFLAEWSDDHGAILGRTAVVVVPPRLFEALPGPVRVLGDDPVLASALQGGGVRVVDDASEAPLWVVAGETVERDIHLARKAVRAGATVVRVARGCDIPIIHREGLGAWLELPASFLDRLAGEPRAQLQLLQCIHAAMRRDVPDPNPPDL